MTRYLIVLNQTRFVEYVDTAGVATTGDSSTAARYENGVPLLQTLHSILTHHPGAVITLVPVR